MKFEIHNLSECTALPRIQLLDILQSAMRNTLNSQVTVDVNKLNLDSVDFETFCNSQSGESRLFLNALRDLTVIETAYNQDRLDTSLATKYRFAAINMREAVEKVCTNASPSILKLKDECLIGNTTGKHDIAGIVTVLRKIVNDYRDSEKVEFFINNFKFPQELLDKESYAKLPKSKLLSAKNKRVDWDKLGAEEGSILTGDGKVYVQQGKIKVVLKVDATYFSFLRGVPLPKVYLLKATVQVKESQRAGGPSVDLAHIASYSPTEELKVIQNIMLYSEKSMDESNSTLNFENLSDITSLDSSLLADLLIAATRNSISDEITFDSDHLGVESIDLEALSTSDNKYARKLIETLNELADIEARYNNGKHPEVLDAHYDKLYNNLENKVEMVCENCKKVLKLKEEYLIYKEPDKNHEFDYLIYLTNMIRYDDGTRLVDEEFLDTFSFPKELLDTSTFKSLPTVDNGYGTVDWEAMRAKGINILLGIDHIFLTYGNYDVTLKLKNTTYDLTNQSGAKFIHNPELTILVSEHGSGTTPIEICQSCLNTDDRGEDKIIVYNMILRASELALAKEKGEIQSF